MSPFSLSMIKIKPATFGREHYSPPYFHPYASLPCSLSPHAAVFFTPSRRSIRPDNMMAGFPKGRVTIVACHPVIQVSLLPSSLRQFHPPPPPKKKITKHKTLSEMSGLFGSNKRNETFDSFGIFRCNALHRRVLTAKDWLNISLLFQGVRKG